MLKLPALFSLQNNYTSFQLNQLIYECAFKLRTTCLSNIQLQQQLDPDLEVEVRLVTEGKRLTVGEMTAYFSSRLCIKCGGLRNH